VHPVSCILKVKAVGGLFSLILVWFGGAQVADGWNTVTPAMEIPRSIPYGAVLCGGLLMLVRSVQALFGPPRAVREAEGGDER